MPEAATPEQRAELVAALYVGEAVLRLRAIEERFPNRVFTHAALLDIAAGRGAAARAALAKADAALVATGAAPQHIMRARAAIMALCEALARHAAFFGVGNDFDAV